LGLLPESVRRAHERRLNLKELRDWERQGKPAPPPHGVKQQAIAAVQGKYGYDTLVETGTYLGDMVWAQLPLFKRIYSIELGVELYQRALARFSKYPQVTLLQGDSGVVLKEIVKQLTAPAIFWLDGHYSAGITAKGEKECPIFEELNAIFASQVRHVLLIDDARCFNGIGDYPGIEQLSEFIVGQRPAAMVDVKDDIIRVEHGK
jgi:hypothetical protein